jgi:UDP-N-acetyl-D-mannosaminuronic acid transferase (WecB/TagA/CpsF family)
MGEAIGKGNMRRILGVNFYVGDAAGAIDRVANGGLVVVPAAPALKDIGRDSSYRAALTNADLVLADSAFMVLAWNLLERDTVSRLSGLRYLRELLLREDVRTPGNTFWIMAGPESAAKNLDWLKAQGIDVPAECVYMAPIYGRSIEDKALIEKLQNRRVRHVVITVGGGTQEQLGLYLKRELGYLPSIHCIGAAIAFLSGDQVKIPEWADRIYLGWLFRCLSSPRRFVPRYLSASKLLRLLMQYRSELPFEQ